MNCSDDYISVAESEDLPIEAAERLPGLSAVLDETEKRPIHLKRSSVPFQGTHSHYTLFAWFSSSDCRRYTFDIGPKRYFFVVVQTL